MDFCISIARFYLSIFSIYSARSSSCVRSGNIFLRPSYTGQVVSRNVRGAWFYKKRHNRDRDQVSNSCTPRL